MVVINGWVPVESSYSKTNLKENTINKKIYLYRLQPKLCIDFKKSLNLMRGMLRRHNIFPISIYRPKNIVKTRYIGSSLKPGPCSNTPGRFGFAMTSSCILGIPRSARDLLRGLYFPIGELAVYMNVYIARWLPSTVPHRELELGHAGDRRESRHIRLCLPAVHSSRINIHSTHGRN